MQCSGESSRWVLVVWSLLPHLRHVGASHILCVKDPQLWHAKMCGRCRQENGSMRIPPMETSFSHWNMLLLSQVENPIIGRLFAGNPNIQFFRFLPNRDVISS